MKNGIYLSKGNLIEELYYIFDFGCYMLIVVVFRNCIAHFSLVMITIIICKKYAIWLVLLSILICLAGLVIISNKDSAETVKGLEIVVI